VVELGVLLGTKQADAEVVHVEVQADPEAAIRRERGGAEDVLVLELSHPG
jgi:hypothetical protein